MPQADTVIIPPPSGDLSDIPDKPTASGLDMTGLDAENRILFINLGFFKFGSDDKAHAGSIVLSITLLLMALLIILVGMFSTNADWLNKVFAWIGSAFTFVAGVSIGRGGKDGPNN